MLREKYTNYTWENLLNDKSFQVEYKLIKNEYNNFNDILPLAIDLDNWYKRVPLDEVKVVIIGQDPYPKAELACGVSFATKNNLLSSSLKNIFKLLDKKENSLLEPNLLYWSQQGILLVNAQPLSRINQPNFYKNKFKFINNLIFFLNKVHTKLVYLLWGNEASRYQCLIGSDNQIIISSHPSPLGCNKKLGNYPSFNNSNCFNKCNKYLNENKIKEISWL